jgi:hypothetical protein
VSKISTRLSGGTSCGPFMGLPPSRCDFDDLVSRGSRAAQRLLPPQGEEKEKRQAVQPLRHRMTGL